MPTLDVIVTVSGTRSPHVAAALSVALYGVVFVPVASTAMLGYAFAPGAGVTFADGLLSVPDTAVAVDAAWFSTRSLNENDSPGSTTLSPSPVDVTSVASCTMPASRRKLLSAMFQCVSR